MRGDEPFAYLSLHVIGGNVCSAYVNMFIGFLINGELFSVWMNPCLTSKTKISVFLFRKNLEHVFIYNTFVKEMHTDQAVNLFSVVSIWVFVQTSMSFLHVSMEVLVLALIEMTYRTSFTYAGAIGNPLLLQDSNARPHIADAYLEQETMQRMQKLARLSGLNTIQHHWDTLGCSVFALIPPPKP
ncbi:hypothetical protein TNCV_2585441 [Trichonephila clavipes]|nr:hypothetical protein TNCV_2585441 [Trichonephila clavipes]